MRAYTPLFLAIVVMAAVFGMPLLLSGPMNHEMGCPFDQGEAAMCAMSVLEHMKYWQLAFASIVLELLAVAALTFIAYGKWKGIAPRTPGFGRILAHSHVPARPTLFQELFSRGILNRKESYIF